MSWPKLSFDQVAKFPSTIAIIREVFVQKNILPEISVCIWQFEAFLFMVYYYLSIVVIFYLEKYFSYVCDAKVAYSLFFAFVCPSAFEQTKSTAYKTVLSPYFFVFSFFFKGTSPCYVQVECMVLRHKCLSREIVVISLSIGIEDSSYDANMVI